MKYQRLFVAAAFLFGSLYFLWKGVGWLVVIAIPFYIGYLILSWAFRYLRFFWGSIVALALCTSYVLCLICVFKAFVFEIYAIPSGSMEKTIFEGDLVVVNKLKYGPIAPQWFKYIPLSNYFQHSDSRLERNQFIAESRYRLSGFGNVERDDIVVFFRDDNSIHQIKRCIGLGGDTLLIVNGDIIINSKKYSPPGSVMKNYSIWLSRRSVYLRLLDSLGISNTDEYVMDGRFDDFITLTEDEARIVKESRTIDSIIFRPDFPYYRKAFPRNTLFKWSYDNLGPITVPYSGMTMPLDRTNFIMYGPTISKYENVLIIEKGEKYFLNGVEVSEYVFQKDYLYMMGDNRANSEDSRHWGFVSTDNIIGQVSTALHRRSKSE